MEIGGERENFFAPSDRHAHVSCVVEEIKFFYIDWRSRDWRKKVTPPVNNAYIYNTRTEVPKNGQNDEFVIFHRNLDSKTLALFVVS